MKLEDRVAIVTGGANGIGRAVALRLAKEEANVVVADIEMESANEVVNEIKALGRKTIALKVDVTKSEDTNQMAKTTLDEFGKIDMLVNVAGGSARERNALFHESTEEIWDYVLNLNLKGTLLCTRAVINHMIERRSGNIVNIGSLSGMMGFTNQSYYSAAKGGVIAFTKALAKEVGSYRIRVNCVSPGTIFTRASLRHSKEFLEERTKLSYLSRLGEPEDIANMVAYLVSDEASYITGQNIPVCGARNLGV